MTERELLATGGIGLVALHLGRGPIAPPLDLAFATFDRARRVQAALAALVARRPPAADLPRRIAGDRVLRDVARVAAAFSADLEPARLRPAIFALRFFSRQDGTWADRVHGDPARFLPDARGQVDLSAYAYVGRSDPQGGPGATFTNFDHAWYDEPTDTWFHANHAEPGMKIFQSTLAHLSRPLAAFDRQVFCVALARASAR